MCDLYQNRQNCIKFRVKSSNFGEFLHNSYVPRDRCTTNLANETVGLSLNRHYSDGVQ